MDLIILTPEKKVFDGVVDRVSFPGIDGEFETLAQHAAIVSQLKEGAIEIVTPERKNIRFQIKSGFVEVYNNRISVIAEGVTE